MKWWQACGTTNAYRFNSYRKGAFFFPCDFFALPFLSFGTGLCGNILELVPSPGLAAPPAPNSSASIKAASLVCSLDAVTGTPFGGGKRKCQCGDTHSAPPSLHRFAVCGNVNAAPPRVKSQSRFKNNGRHQMIAQGRRWIISRRANEESNLCFLTRRRRRLLDREGRTNCQGLGYNVQKR